MAEAAFMPGAPAGFVAESGLRGFEQGQSMMIRAQAARQAQEMNALRLRQAEQQIAENIMLAPVKQAQARADIEKARVDLNVAQRTQENRRNAYALYDQAVTDFEYINLIPNAKARAQASREWLGRYSQLENVSELNKQVTQMNELATRNITAVMGIAGLGGAEAKMFGALTENMSPEEQEKARRVKLGLEGRASGAPKFQPIKVTLPDGSEATLSFDKSTGQTGVPSVATPSGSPREGNQLVGPSTAADTQAKEAGKLRAERDAARPKRQAALEKVETTTDRLVDDIDSAIAQVSAATAGPGGVILGVFPGTSAKDLQSNLDTIAANVGFEALNAMREASKTGGALGSITERELDLLQATLASLKVGQSPSQLIANLKKARNRIAQNAGAARRAFDTEYGDNTPNTSSDDLTVGSYKVRVK